MSTNTAASLTTVDLEAAEVGTRVTDSRGEAWSKVGPFGWREDPRGEYVGHELSASSLVTLYGPVVSA